MPKKNNITADGIISHYMDYVSEHNAQPNTIEEFTNLFNVDEEEYYNYFDDFEGLEEHIFYMFFEHTILTIEKSEDYHMYDPRNKLLIFYFTFFELLSANRAYALYAFKTNSNILKSRERLHKLRNAFKDYIESLNIKLLNFNQESIDNFQLKSFKESAWLQLLFTIKFWQDDDSTSFEKTDILIEKSLKATFDLIDTQPIQSVIDLGKFLLKEKFQFTK